MSQCDAVLKFPDRATAMADAVVISQTYLDGQSVRQWLGQNVVECQIWRASQDTVDGLGNPVHHPLPGFFVLVSLPAVIPALLNHAAVQLVVDRDKMNAGQAGMVLKSGVSNAILQDIRISPIFAGMSPPWGALT